MRKLLLAAAAALAIAVPAAAEASPGVPAEQAAPTAPAPAPATAAPAEFDNLWVPGLSAGCLVPFGNPSPFTGASFRFDALYGLDTKRPEAFNADRGRWEIFVDVGLYGDFGARQPGGELLFLWALGFNLSFATPATLDRNYLVPYVGLELGGLTSSRRGSGLLALPLLGLNIVSLPNCSLSVEAGCALNTLDFNEFLGVLARVNLNFTL